MGGVELNNWLQSEGGAFVLMGSNKRQRWMGDVGLSTPNPFPPVGNDYTRAARFLAHEGVISDEDGEVFVFFSEGLCARIFGSNKEFFLVSWDISDNYHESSISDINSLKLIYQRDLFYFYISESNISLFDSKCSNFPFEINSIEVEKGRYKVSTFTSVKEETPEIGYYIIYRFLKQ